MTPQDIFDQCATHLFTQGRPAMEDRGGDSKCLYRAPGGLKCAVGYFIPDDVYSPKMDRDSEGSGTCVHHIAVAFPGIPEWFQQHVNLLGQLQSAHDECETNNDGTFNTVHLYNSLHGVALEYDLSLDVLDRLAKA